MNPISFTVAEWNQFCKEQEELLLDESSDDEFFSIEEDSTDNEDAPKTNEKDNE